MRLVLLYVLQAHYPRGSSRIELEALRRLGLLVLIGLKVTERFDLADGVKRPLCLPILVLHMA